MAGFVGSPQMNFVKGKHRGGRRRAGFRLRQAPSPLSGYAFASRPSPGQDVVLGVRPEHMEIGQNGGTWPGFTIDIVEPMGADMVIWCSDGEGPVQVRTEREQKGSAGRASVARPRSAQISLFAAESGDRL